MPPPKSSKAWTVDQKIKVLADAAKLSGEQLPAFLEQLGLRFAELQQWRLSLEGEGRASKAITKRIRGLERELARKEIPR